MKGKKLQPRILYPERLSFRFNREIKNFTAKQKLREFTTTKPVFPQRLMELLLVEKKRPQIETRKLRMENFAVKCKHTVKVGNNLHTNMIIKLAIVKRG